MPKHILVTGAAGFIGQALTAALQEDGHSVFAMTRAHGDVAEAETFAALNSAPVDIVYHLAGKTDVAHSWEKPGEFYRVNVVGTQRALDFCHQHGARFIYLSTYVYGSPRYLPVDEQHPVNPANPYTHSKWLGEELCQFYASHYGMPITRIRLFNVYGPGQSEQFLIPHLLREIARGETINVRSLTSRRDMLYIDDVIEALRLLSQTPHSGVYNLGYGTSWSVAEIADVLQKELGTSLPLQASKKLPPNELIDIVADISNICKVLCWHPQYDLYHGLRMLLKKTTYKKGNYKEGC